MTFNPPRFARPIPDAQPMVAIPASEYERMKATTPTVPTTASNYKTPDDGYRRYAKCLTCNQAYKIFTCYAQSERHCKQFGPATHTHFSCGCNNGTAITMEGSVRIGTRKDRVVYIEVPVSDHAQEEQQG